MSWIDKVNWTDPRVVAAMIAGTVALVVAIIGGFFILRAARRKADAAPSSGGSTNTGTTSGANSPGVVQGNATYIQSTIIGQRPGAQITDETINAILRRNEKNLTEKDGKISTLIGQLSKRDDLIQGLRDGLARAKAEAQKGDATARAALEELRKSGNTEKLQHLLDAERGQHKSDFIERSLEVAAIAFLRGDIPTTRRCLDEVLRLAPHDVRALNQLGHLEHLLGNLDDAEQAYKTVLAAGKKESDEMIQAVAYGNLGIVYQTRGALDEAEAMFKKSLAINEKLGRLEGMANQYGNLGNVYELRGDKGKAREFWIKSRDLFAQIGMPHMVEKMQGWLDGAGP